MPNTTAVRTAQVGAAPFFAGKNKIINGDFNINQRGFTSLTADAYGFDRWLFVTNTGTTTYSSQSFTLGTAPVTGYEGTTFARMLTSGQSGTGAYSVLQQRIESVRTFANQTVTVSFWAKAASGTPKIAIEFQQVFGSGGSALVNTYIGQATLSTSWTRYSITGTVPSISGKTIGTTDYLALRMWVSAGTDFNSNTGSIGVQNNTFDIWGVQAEAGSVATAFQTATGTLAGELAACQRYYYRIAATTAYTQFTNFAPAYSTTNATMMFPTKVTMRTTPTAIEYANVTLTDGTNFVAAGTLTIGTYASPETVLVTSGTTGLTATTRSYSVWANNNNTAYLAMSAEL